MYFCLCTWISDTRTDTGIDTGISLFPPPGTCISISRERDGKQERDGNRQRGREARGRESGRNPEVEVQAREARWEEGEKVVENSENSTKEYQEDAFHAVKDESSTAQTGKRQHENVGTEQEEFDNRK
jgi:hypothetical protein